MRILPFIVLVCGLNLCPPASAQNLEVSDLQVRPSSAANPADARTLHSLSINRLMRTQIDVGEDISCSSTRSSAFPVGDIFEIPTRIIPRPNHPRPEKAGKCLDLSEFRPVLKLLPEEQQAWNLPTDPGRISVANVRGVNSFYVASIPVDSAESLRYHIYSSGSAPVGGHSEVVVHFNEPVILRPQFPADNQKTIVTHDLLLSLQGISSKGAEFVPGGYDGSYISAIGISLLEFKIKRMHDEGTLVNTFSVDLPPADLSNYIRTYLAIANTARLNQVYNVFGDRNPFYNDDYFVFKINNDVVDIFGDKGGNCITIHMILLDKVLGSRYTASQRMAISSELLSYFDPQHALQGLEHRGVLTSPEHNALGVWSEDPFVVQVLNEIKLGNTAQMP